MKLNIMENIRLGAVISGQQGNAGLIRACTKLLDKLEFTKEERSKYAITESGDGVIRWNTGLAYDGGLLERTFTGQEQQMIVDFLSNPNLNIPTDRVSLSLLNKFGIMTEEDTRPAPEAEPVVAEVVHIPENPR